MIKYKNYIINLDNWQWPAITEMNALKNFLDYKTEIKNFFYLGFPWATLIDFLKQNKKTKANILIKELNSFSDELQKKEKIVTVCQHIHMLKYIDIFKSVNVTDIYWSHNEKNLKIVEGINLHPFPLYPVKYIEFMNEKKNNKINVIRKKKYIASFVGARSNNLYLSKTRNQLEKYFENKDYFKILIYNDWHYQDLVYKHQIFEEAVNFNNLIVKKYPSSELTTSSDEYLDTMINSIFIICPSGTGPNSIRLWEALAFGAIPVIISDNLELPGDKRIWEEAAVFCDDNESSLKELPDRLIYLSSKIDKINKMKKNCHMLHLNFGPHFSIKDIIEDNL